MALYDQIGNSYTKTRGSDSSIAATLLQILEVSQTSSVVDIVAGTGSYALALAEHGYRVLAVEPSVVMRDRAVQYAAIRWMIDRC